jgi:hypothetical protein
MVPPVEVVVSLLLLDEGQDHRQPVEPHHADVPRRKGAVARCVLGEGEAELPQIRLALRAAGTLTGGLNRRQQEPHNQADDRDDDEQLHQRQAGSLSHPPARRGKHGIHRGP